MPGPGSKKRSMPGKLQGPSKKQRRQNLKAYHSESEDEADQGFDAVNLMDSDDDIMNAKVDDAASDNDSDSSSNSGDEAVEQKLGARKGQLPKKAMKLQAQQEKDTEAGDNQEEDEEDDENDDAEDSDMDDDDDDGDSDDEGPAGKSRSKRHDPTAFATSLSKILSTKLSSSKRADPVLARSAAAHEASKAAVETALETKAKRQLREQKRQALERGRVKDVLIPAVDKATGVPEVSTAEMMETERRLRKVAQRGVVKLFNAVRTAQVKAAEAEKGNRKDGVLGYNKREEKVNELSKKGFLELIASGGGGLKKGGLEEA